MPKMGIKMWLSVIVGMVGALASYFYWGLNGGIQARCSYNYFNYCYNRMFAATSNVMQFLAAFEELKNGI